jgi:hypothetical protein
MRRTLSPPVELTEEDIAAHDVAREELERIGGERHVYDPDEIARGAILLIVALVFAVPAAVAGGLCAGPWRHQASRAVRNLAANRLHRRWRMRRHSGVDARLAAGVGQPAR